MTPPLLPKTIGGWFRATAACIVLLGGAYTSWLVFDGYNRDKQDSATLSAVDEAIENQQQSAESTRCAREVTAAGEVAQLETLATLQDGLLDLMDDLEVTGATEAQVRDLDSVLDEAIEGYEQINVTCPVPNADDSDGDPNPD